MKLWSRLYLTVWLAFFSCVLLPRWMGVYAGHSVHVVLGLIMVFLTLGNARQLAALSVPARLKRISKVTAGFAIFQIVAGGALGAVMHFLPDTPYIASVIYVAHIVCALAILAQASSLATAYDMWEEKEFSEV
jgi:hypothetical protein